MTKKTKFATETIKIDIRRLVMFGTNPSKIMMEAP